MRSHELATTKTRFVKVVFNSQNIISKIVHSRLLDMKSKIIDDTDESFHKPSDDEIREVTEATRQALEKITTAKVIPDILS